MKMYTNSIQSGRLKQWRRGRGQRKRSSRQEEAINSRNRDNKNHTRPSIPTQMHTKPTAHSARAGAVTQTHYRALPCTTLQNQSHMPMQTHNTQTKRFLNFENTRIPDTNETTNQISELFWINFGTQKRQRQNLRTKMEAKNFRAI